MWGTYRRSSFGTRGTAPRPERRPRRGGHRRRRAARDRHQRQRRVRLPRRQRRDHARGVRAGRRLGVSVGAQVSYDDRENFGRVARDVPARCCASRSPTRSGRCRRSRRRPGRRCATSSRTARSTTGSSTTRSRPRRCSRAPGTLPVLGMPGALLRGAEGAGRVVWREGFPDRGYGADGRLLPRDRPGALLEDAEEIAAQALELAGRRSTRSACTATAPARSTMRAPYDVRWRPPGWVAAGVSDGRDPDFVHRPSVHVECVWRKPANLWT